MKSRDVLVYSRVAAALSVAAFFLVSTYVVWQGRTVLLHADGAVMRSEAVLGKINASAVNLDKATATWAAASKSQADAVGDLVTDAHGTLSQASGALGSVQTTVDKLGTSADALTGEIAALHATTDTVTAAIADARPAIQGIRPVEDSATDMIGSANEVLKRKAIGELLDHAAGVVTHGDAIAGDAQQIADKETKEFLKPVKWYMWPVKRASQFIDIGAAVSRNLP